MAADYEDLTPPSLRGEAADFARVQCRVSLQSILEVKVLLEERHHIGVRRLGQLEEQARTMRLAVAEVLDAPYAPDANRHRLMLLRELIAVEREAALESIEEWRDALELHRELRALWKTYFAIPRP